MNIVNAVIAHAGEALPPIKALGYEYVVAANGLFIRAEDSRMEACALVQAFDKPLFGLAEVKPCARLKLPRLPAILLEGAFGIALDNLPREVMVQFVRDDGWRLCTPSQEQTRISVTYCDTPGTVLDLHSHGYMHPFWSNTDNTDEKGLRFYAVIGDLSHAPFMPHICLRAGVYGHYVDVKLSAIFETNEPDFAGSFGLVNL